MQKIIKLNNDTELIAQSLLNKRSAQKMLYDKYAPRMLSLCRYYIKDNQQSEEVMLNGFFKVFTKLSTFSNKGSFEGWLRKIMVRESISFLRSKKELYFTNKIEIFGKYVENEVELDICVEDLHHYVNQLSSGCKVIFNMYVIEGYKHAEIASILDISEGTSKTQLSRARSSLQKMISLKQKFNHGNG